MKARYKYRIYPNQSQIKKLNQLFGCCQYVWNQSLAYCHQLYANGENKPSYVDLTKQFITQAKKKLICLKDVVSTPLQQSLKDLDRAYKNFFDSCQGKRKEIKVKPPKFKSINYKQAARFVGANHNIYQDKIYFQKIGKIKINWSIRLPSPATYVTVIKYLANRYFAIFVIEICIETCTENFPKTDNSIGINLGILSFATLSNGEKIEAPKPLKKNLKKLAKIQGKLDKKTSGSKRRNKARLRVAKLHGKIKDIRTGFLYKLSTNLVRKYDTILLEDLNISGMIKNRSLAKAISDLGWRQFQTLTEAKCDKYGREFRVINRWEPTSQKCSYCGFKGGKKEINVREWTCLNCGILNDRDINTAVNILNTQSVVETVVQLKTKVESVETELENSVQLPLFNVVARGHSETKEKRTRRKSQTGCKSVDSNDSLTRPKFEQLRLF